jgi:branched-chain amino acid transport system ATP-binding protein
VGDPCPAFCDRLIFAAPCRRNAEGKNKEIQVKDCAAMASNQRASTGKKVIELIDVHKSFDQLRVITGVSLDILTNERHAIIGPNGAGKSTLFNLISGNYVPDQGDIRLNGRSIKGLRPESINRFGLARSFQITSVFNQMTVQENLNMAFMGRYGYRFTMLRMMSRLTRVHDEAEKMLDKLRLSHRKWILAGELSYSEQRALEVGMTIATGANVILLDEPTSGMSRQETKYATELIRELTAGKTLLVVEHDMSVVFELCDRISVLVYGNILASGPPEEIKNNKEVQGAYLGKVM